MSGLTEQEWIEQLRLRFPVRPPVEVGIGDDGAVIDCRSAARQVVVTDMLLEGTHFDLHCTTPALVGRKAVAVNLSDLAAMGCWPTAAFVSLAVPHSLTQRNRQFLQQLYDGMAALTDEYDFTMAGGDTNAWSGPLAVNVCLTGVPVGARPVLRSTARPGQQLFVTGALGGSLSSQRHLTFTPQLAAARWLVQHLQVQSMMDISDGLSLDVQRLADASEVAILLDAVNIPIHADVSSELPHAQRLTAALNDGEDFELLFSLDAADSQRLAELQADCPVRCTRVGEVVAGRGVQLRTTSGQLQPLQAGGWQHLI